MALAEALLELQELTERLRRDCPWDREQTAMTIVPHTVEEAYEVADAAFAADDAKLLDELGDLLFQVYFLALLLQEKSRGDLEGAARAVTAKLIRRHPHVFDELGDVLFAAVNVARRLNVNPELALRATSRRFRDRVERAEERAAANGEAFRELSLEAKDAYFDQAKEEFR